MKKLMIAVLMMVSIAAKAESQAQYFRVWQGFQRVDLSCEEFLGQLPAFMKETVDLYKETALNNYIVVMPPQNRPSYIPDELALVALSSKEEYQRIRATPEGQRYTERHWDIFDKNKSQSVQHFIDYSNERPIELVSNSAYDMIGQKISWASGANFVFIGTRKVGLSPQEYLSRLQSHVEMAKAVMGPKGLRGYIIIANENYEVAYLNWDSKEDHDAAVSSVEGQAVFRDADQFMDTLMYEPALPFRAGQSIKSGAAYSTMQE